jgi:hypothetical protein
MTSQSDKTISNSREKSEYSTISNLSNHKRVSWSSNSSNAEDNNSNSNNAEHNDVGNEIGTDIDSCWNRGGGLDYTGQGMSGFECRDCGHPN